MEKAMSTTEKPLVSVWMAAYYAGDHIAQGIESILMQETDYPYEIVINDDCSGDNTWEVVSQYAAKYPDIIRAKRNEKNLGLCANVLDTKLRCKGKYIVNLSGDDYWIDKKKIQKQADFLESHPDYVAVGSKVELRYDDEQEAFSSYPWESNLGKDYTLEGYNQDKRLPSHGLMVRNVFADPEKKPIIEKVYGVSSTVDDLYDPVLYLQFGKIYIMPEATCVYRNVKNKKGKHNFNSSKKVLDRVTMILDGYNSLETLQLPGVDLKVRIKDVFNLIVLDRLTHLDFKTIRKTYRTIPLRYRKPWYKSVGMMCLVSLPKEGFNAVKNRLRRSRK